MSGGYGRAVAALQSRVRSRALPAGERARLAAARVALVEALAGDCAVCAGFVGRPVGTLTVVHLLQVHRVEYDAL